jgi:hypothetical protein
MLADVFQELDLARADPFVAVEVDANAQLGKRSGGRPCHASNAFSPSGARLPPKLFTNKVNGLDILRGDFVVGEDAGCASGNARP